MSRCVRIGASRLRALSPTPHAGTLSVSLSPDSSLSFPPSPSPSVPSPSGCPPAHRHPLCLSLTRLLPLIPSLSFSLRPLPVWLSSLTHPTRLPLSYSPPAPPLSPHPTPLSLPPSPAPSVPVRPLTPVQSGSPLPLSLPPSRQAATVAVAPPASISLPRRRPSLSSPSPPVTLLVSTSSPGVNLPSTAGDASRPADAPLLQRRSPLLLWFATGWPMSISHPRRRPSPSPQALLPIFPGVNLPSATATLLAQQMRLSFSSSPPAPLAPPSLVAALAWRRCADAPLLLL